MFGNFTGQSRRPRQVNLSGRSRNDAPNPFGRKSTAAGAQSSIQSAQAERERRAAEKKRRDAATKIQRSWRAAREKGERRDELRKSWDLKAINAIEWDAWEGKTELLELTMMILDRKGAFVVEDLDRLKKVFKMMGAVDEWKYCDTTDARLRFQYSRLLALIIRMLDRSDDLLRTGDAGFDLIHTILQWMYSRTLIQFFRITPYRNQLGTRTGESTYYGCLSTVIRVLQENDKLYPDFLIAVLLAAAKPIHQGRQGALKEFVTTLVPSKDFPELLNSTKYGEDTAMEFFKTIFNVQSLMEGFEDQNLGAILSLDSHLVAPRLSILSFMISLAHEDFVQGKFGTKAAHGYVRFISFALSSSAGEISRRIDIEDSNMDMDDDDDEELKPLPTSIRQNIIKLREKPFISSVFESGLTATNQSDTLQQAGFLASFALALLFVFPSDRQELRMWMCLATTSSGEPLVKHLWKAVRSTGVYSKILQAKSDEADSFIVNSLKPRLDSGKDYDASQRDEEWRIILLFLEIYGFVLVMMDDEEFFQGGQISDGTAGTQVTKVSALPLAEVQELTTFLKNLAFAVHWNSWSIDEYARRGPNAGSDDEKRTKEEPAVVGVRGLDTPYVKGVVTTLLRQVYGRDSRRQFLPTNFWLMTHRFDMGESFIPAIVIEEENRHRLEEEEADSDDEEEPLDVLTNPIQRHQARLRRYREKELANRQNNYLAPVAPRLEILQTLPFFIPFETRVKIFREFISVDQRRRRGEDVLPENFGASNPGTRRQSSFHSGFVHPNLRGMNRTPIGSSRQGGMDPGMHGRNRATIRRKYIFDDAFEAFYPIGENFKDPIQITFVDEYGEQEEGIDGGGITKDFLTSVTKEAFLPDEEEQRNKTGLIAPIPLFVGNAKHELYPNPMSVLQTQAALDSVMLSDLKAEHTKLLLQRYEFLGRIVGKCLYEGVLLDIAFAGFFLLKWSHRDTGANDGYKPSLNDLRDLDEDLYRGLIHLKNYSGPVEELSLNFTTTLPLSEKKTRTFPLLPGGDSVPVTSTNRLQYIHLLTLFRLSLLPQAQTQAFLTGLTSIIRPTWLTMFNQVELQTLVGGDDAPLDISDWERNTVYSGLYQVGTDGKYHPTITLFWRVLREDLSEAQRRAVVKFVTSVSRAPLLGFRGLVPAFCIRDAVGGEGGEERLPSASTCVNLLKLPVYKSRRVLREKLLMAVESGTGFHLS